MKTSKIIVLLFFVAPALLFTFQNCGSKSFDFDEDSAFKKECAVDASTSTDCYNYQEDSFVKTYGQAPTDILFVMDESCSMATIIDAVKSGFNSLQGSNFPIDTKMAVTYMSPDKEIDGKWDFNTPYHSNVSIHYPGHMKLVSKQSIDNYVNIFPDHDSAFPIMGCNDEWFSPHQKDANNQYCLNGATQLAPGGNVTGTNDDTINWCTGIESGMVTLEQTLKKYTQSGKKLFRNGAKVNVIFVSDTHEPGANYWGRPGALSEQRSLQQIQSFINENNPTVSSIKFSGVLPIPVAGDPLYQGLKVVGAIPQNADEAKINGEQFWDYSYLPYIKATGGVVSHAKNNNWQAIASQIATDSKSTGNIILNLSRHINKIFSVKVNGHSIDLSKVTVNADAKSISINYSSSGLETLDISIQYQALY